MSLLTEIAQDAEVTEDEARRVLRALIRVHWGTPEDVGPVATKALKDMVRKHVLDEHND